MSKEGENPCASWKALFANCATEESVTKLLIPSHGGDEVRFGRRSMQVELVQWKLEF